MWKRRIRPDIPEINATSTADMAFMLLIFFLLTTSLETEKSISRRLVPLTDSVDVQPLIVKKRNLLDIRLDSEGKIYFKGHETSLSLLKELVRKCVENTSRNDSMPEVNQLTLPLIGEVPVFDAHILALRYDAHTDYNTYFAVQSILMEVYADICNDLSIKYFHVPYKQASSSQQEMVCTCCPIRISEHLFEKEGGTR